MSTEPDLTTQEGAAGNGGEGGVSVEVLPETAAPKTEPAPDVQPDGVAPDSAEFMAKVAAAFEAEPADEVLKHVAVADVENLAPGKERGIVRALVAHRAAEREKDAAAAAKRDAEYAAREKALEEREAVHRRERAALFAMATSPALDAARAAKKPDVDPLTPEGMEALAKYHADKNSAAQFAQLHAAEVEHRNIDAYAQLKKQYPVIVEKDAEWRAHMAEMNKGISHEDVKAGKAEWRVKVTDAAGAELFAARQEVLAARAAAEARAAAQVADRQVAARNITRASSGGHAESDLRIPDDVEARYGSVTDYLRTLPPERKRAVLAHAGVH